MFRSGDRKHLLICSGRVTRLAASLNRLPAFALDLASQSKRVPAPAREGWWAVQDSNL
jgi:hypothetical protein